MSNLPKPTTYKGWHELRLSYTPERRHEFQMDYFVEDHPFEDMNVDRWFCDVCRGWVPVYEVRGELVCCEKDHVIAQLLNKVIPFGKYSGVKWRDVPQDYKQFLQDKDIRF